MSRNTPHKRYDILIQAFVELIVKHPQKPIFLMCVCDKGNLFDLFADELKRKGAVIADFSNRLLVSARHDSLSDEDVGLFYKIADCGVSCADGGALGLCVLEHMAHGIPQVVSNIVAHRDICKADNSILVEPVVRIQVAGEFVQLVSPSSVAQALETYVLNEPLRKGHGLAAATTVTAAHGLAAATAAASAHGLAAATVVAAAHGLAATAATATAATSSIVKRLDLLRQERDIDAAP